MFICVYFYIIDMSKYYAMDIFRDIFLKILYEYVYK